MSDHPRIEVSSLRKWLEDIQNQLSPTKWSLLLICYLSEIPYGHLEQLQDTADLYNKLIEKHHFTPDESFQLLLRRLSFLKEDGRNCIRALAAYNLPQSESIPDLSSKLSPVSHLVECIVKTFIELNAVQQNMLLHHLAREHLKTNEQNLSLLELFSKLIQGKILAVDKTQPLIDGLKQIRTPPDALCHLRDYHEYLHLGDFEYSIEPVTSPEFLTPQPLVRGPGSRGQRGRTGTPGGDSSSAFYSCSGTDVSINYGEEAPDVHAPHQVVSHSDSSTQAAVTAQGVIHPPRPSGGSVTDYSSSERARLLPNHPEPGTQWSHSKKAKCGFFIFGIVTLLLLLISSMATLAGVHPSFSSTYLAYADNQDVTVSLGTVDTLWYSPVTIRQQEVTGYSVPHASIYVVPSSEVKRQDCSASVSCSGSSGPITEKTRKAGQVVPLYMLEGASFNYTLCLKNYSNNATATAFIFDNNTAFTEFLDFLSDGYKSSVLHQNLPIANGTSEYDCTSIIFTSSHDSYYYITTEVTFDDRGSTDQRIDSQCSITTHLKCFNYSGYTDLCTLSEDSKTCHLNLLGLKNLTFPWVENYTMLAFVEVGPTTSFVVDVGKSWYILVLPAIGFIFIAVVILVISVPVLVLYRRRHPGG